MNDLDNVEFVSSNVHSSRQEAFLYVFEDNKAVIKMIIKGRSPTMKHVSRTQRVALDWLFARINLDLQIQIKYVDTKTNSQTYWPREILHVMNGIIFCVCSSASSSDYSEWNVDEKSSSQEWKSNEMFAARTVRPVGGQPAGPFTQHTDKFVIDDDDMDSDAITESDLSLKSRSFLRRVNDRVRKILDQSSKDAMQDIDKHSLIWRLFMSSTIEASVFTGKNYSENLHYIKNTGNFLTLKQMFDKSEKLTNNLTLKQMFDKS